MDWYQGHGTYEMTNLKARTLCIASKILMARRTRQFSIYEQFTRQEVDKALQAGRISVRFLHGVAEPETASELAAAVEQAPLTAIVGEPPAAEAQAPVEAPALDKDEDVAGRPRRRGRKED